MSSYEIVIHFSIFNKPYMTSFETKVLKYQEEKPLGLVWFISSCPIMHSSDKKALRRILFVGVLLGEPHPYLREVR